MALYQNTLDNIDLYIFDNITEQITGAILNDVLKTLVPEVGARQVYINPATTDNPGTPQNPRVYIALPGTYTNFGGLTITGPVGALIWDGTSWTKVELPMPSAYENFRCKLNQQVAGPLAYTTISITQDNGGITANAGQWVQFVNQRTGRYECFQLAYDVTPLATEITIVETIPNNTFPAGSIVEIDPMVNMKWHSKVLWGDGVNNYVDLPAAWKTPPATCIDPDVFDSIFRVQINQVEAYRIDTPVAPLHYDLNASNRLRLEFADVLSVQDRVVVRALMPRHL